MTTYADALSHLADMVRAVPGELPQKQHMESLIPMLAPGEWAAAEYPLGHLLSQAAQSTIDDAARTSLVNMAVAIGDVRGAAWAEYGTRYI